MSVNKELPAYMINEEMPDYVNMYMELTGTRPSMRRYFGFFIYDELFAGLKEVGAKLEWMFEDGVFHSALFSLGSVSKKNLTFIRMRRSFPDNVDEYILTKDQEEAKNFTVSSEVDVFYNIKSVIDPKLDAMLKRLPVRKNNNISKISIICQDEEIGFYTKEFSMLKQSQYDFDLDLHYGTGFTKYHDANIKRIDESSKGIILLYGAPGTGKSFYIRRLIRDLMRKQKRVLYLPSNMVDMLGTPSFNNFMLEWASDMEDDGQQKKEAGVLIVIEDAERVLIKRENNQYGGDGVSNILNSTDGIMNDFLNIQVLATFNCSISQIDEAILRKKRALSIREFTKLSIEDSQKLVDSLGLDVKIKESMSIADIYSLSAANEDVVLFDEDKKPVKKMGF